MLELKQKIKIGWSFLIQAVQINLGFVYIYNLWSYILFVSLIVNLTLILSLLHELDSYISEKGKTFLNFLRNLPEINLLNLL